jgi:hypothetical protein
LDDRGATILRPASREFHRVPVFSGLINAERDYRDFQDLTGFTIETVLEANWNKP